MWFLKKKDLEIEILGNKFKVTWEELGELLIGLSEAGMTDDFKFISLNLKRLKELVENNCEDYVIASISFRTALYYASLFGKKAEPIMNKGNTKNAMDYRLMKVNFNKKFPLETGDQTEKYHKSFCIAMQQITQQARYWDDSDQYKANSLGMILSNHLFNSYKLEDKIDPIGKHLLASHFDETIIKTLNVLINKTKTIPLTHL